MPEQVKPSKKNALDDQFAVLRVPLLLRPIRSAVDFGCNGRASWLGALTECGINDVVGVDIMDPDSTLTIPVERYVKFDLSKPLDLCRRFDLVIGLEVAEHISPEHGGADNYVETLARHGDYILFSAAIPGQGGIG